MRRDRRHKRAKKRPPCRHFWIFGGYDADKEQTWKWCAQCHVRVWNPRER